MIFSRLHLGVSDLALETVFRTVDGFVTPWVNWDSGEPSGNLGHAHGVEDAVVRLSGGKWRDRSVSQTHPFFCEGTRFYSRFCFSTKLISINRQ